ncbi:hypothetical protein BH20GEM1_BH20GEM1_00610 [soil metagenome]
MPLMSLWQTNPDAVRQLAIGQVVATAGDGRLRDGSECQKELRDYLRSASVSTLAGYVDRCLMEPFDKSGHVLQDIVNEFGRRLDYTVSNGAYQGAVNAIGYDGIWIDPSGHALVVEVKTTDAYRLSLDTVMKYLTRLQSEGTIGEERSVLIVVGRTDTGELEAQVRGSQHAWDVRLISIDALVQLVRTKESADEDATVAKIRRLLTPLEYTRLDALVDVVFAAAKDIEQAVEAEVVSDTAGVEGTANDGTSWEFTPRGIIEAKRESIIGAMALVKGSAFVQRSRAKFSDPDDHDRLVCSVSKRYDQGAVRYWFAYHPAWHDFLSAGSRGWFVLGGIDLDTAFAIPVDVMSQHLGDFHHTVKPDGGRYFHIKILHAGGGLFRLQVPRAKNDLDLTPYSLQLPMST